VSQKLNGRDEARYVLINKSEAEFLNIHCADLKQINKSSLIESLEKVFQQFNIDILEIEFNNTLH
jgi:hypothetical protein